MTRASFLPATLGLCAALAATSSAQVNVRPITESHAPDAPLASLYSSSDILAINSPQADPIIRQWTNADLGLLVGDNVDAFSDGTDFFPSPGPALGGPVTCRRIVVEHTLDPASVGFDPVIAAECAGNGCASDSFRVVFDLAGGIGIDQATDALGISARPLETDIDALAWGERTRYPVYFSVDEDTAMLMGVSPADILVQNFPGGPVATQWSEAALGLVPGDDVDALAVMTAPGVAPGFTCATPPPPLPLGFVVFSLSRTSPSVTGGGLDAADLLEPGTPPRLWATPPQLGLQPTFDNLNGVRITDPYDPACGDGSQLNPVSGGPSFWESLRMNGSPGNVQRMVFVSPSGPATFEVDALNPTDLTSIYVAFGRPCDPIPPFDPGLGFGCLAFLPSGGTSGTFFGDSGPIPWPALAPGLVLTLQGIVLDGVSGTPEKTNVLSVAVKCS